MAHDAPHTPCCLLTDEAEQDEDPEAFTGCETCQVAAHIETMDRANREAWSLYRQVVSRFTMDTQAVPVVLQRLTADLDADEFAETLARFEILYDAVCPKRQTGE